LSSVTNDEKSKSTSFSVPQPQAPVAGAPQPPSVPPMPQGAQLPQAQTGPQLQDRGADEVATYINQIMMELTNLVAIVASIDDEDVEKCGSEEILELYKEGKRLSKLMYRFMKAVKKGASEQKQ